MKAIRTIASSLSILALSLITPANAQWGMDSWGNMNQWDEQVRQYNQYMDQWTQQQMQHLQTQADQEYARVQQFFINYYREHTRDYTTPDQQALILGDQLYCQNNPVQCQQNAQYADEMTRISAQGHQQRMNDIASWGQTQTQIGQTYSDILDMSHQGHMDRSAAQYQGQVNYVQGAIHGEANYYNSNGFAYSLPTYPDPNMYYQTPEGYPLVFDYQNNTWYQVDSYGWRTALQQR